MGIKKVETANEDDYESERASVPMGGYGICTRNPIYQGRKIKSGPYDTSALEFSDLR